MSQAPGLGNPEFQHGPRPKRGAWIAAHIGMLFCIVGLATQSLHAADITLPQIDPLHSIRVEGESWAKANRGAYEVLVFFGKCKLTQGDFTATANRITLWVDRESFSNRAGGITGTKTPPGKAIVLLEGGAHLNWSGGRSLQDHRWMGRLFSLRPVVCVGTQVERHDLPNANDIPRLDWAHASPAGVTTAQYLGNLHASVVTASGQQSAPPLLGAPQSRSNSTTTNAAPRTPNAVQWNPPESQSQARNRYLESSGQPAGPTYVGGTGGGLSGSTRNSEALPQSGIVIPQDGSQPYPANQPPAQSPTPEAISPLGNGGPLPNELTQGYYPGLDPQTVMQVPAAPSVRSVVFSGRDSQRPLEVGTDYDEVADETIFQVIGGFRIAASGVRIPQANGTYFEAGAVSLEADNAVIWQRGKANFGDLVSTPERPIELYLEGNIVFSQGNRVIYADRMYYNLESEYGTILGAEVLTPAPQFQGLVRLKSDVLQQINGQRLMAYGAAVTSSRMGVPRYWLQADEVELTDGRSQQEADGLVSRVPQAETKMRARAKNNFVYVGGVPIFYWPTFSTDLRRSDFYLSSVSFGNDAIFGTQVYATWDVFHLLGMEPPLGTSLKLSTDYLSDRGPAVGLRYDYNRETLLFGVPSIGFTDAWLIQDSGLDILGSDRSLITPEEETRGRINSRHRFFPAENWVAMVETGWISDRNFLEQYFENEWEQQKDFDTAARLRRNAGNQQLDIYASWRVNEFFTETESLPRIDHHILGQDLFSQLFTWSAKTSLSYSHQRPATTPTDPVDAAKFALRPWETDSEGGRFITRQEISMPVSLGVLNINPFLSGEAGYWNEDVNGDDVSRLVGQAGIRASMPMWKVYPNIDNRILDLRGIAHKATFESEFFYADASEDLDRFPLYDRLDDNSQEHFHRRMVFNTFDGALPPQFDQRSFALRSGMQRWVTAGSSEIADDLTQVRFGINQRWQTKRGLAGRERIVDVVALDVDFTVFPKADRDNFGEEVGVIDYDFRYHVGDRLTVLSDGYFDVFSQGLKMISLGTLISRPGRGDAYIGLLSIEGPISANVLNGYTNYRLSEKWILRGGAAFDFGETGSIGQSLGLTRIGESALINVGVNIDHGRDNVSFSFNIEPRFFQQGLLGIIGGELVPPAGFRGVE